MMILFLHICNIKGTRTTLITNPIDMEHEHDKKNMTLCWLNSRTAAVYIQRERVIYRYIIGSRNPEKDVSVPSEHMNKIEDLCNDTNENDNEHILLLGEYNNFRVILDENGELHINGKYKDSYLLVDSLYNITRYRDSEGKDHYLENKKHVHFECNLVITSNGVLNSLYPISFETSEEESFSMIINGIVNIILPNEEIIDE